MLLWHPTRLQMYPRNVVVSKPTIKKVSVELKKLRIQHVEKQLLETPNYYWYRKEVIQSPDRAISIIFDGIDQSHTNVPLLSKWTSHKTVSNRLIGVKVLGIGTRSCTCKWTISRRIKRVFFFFGFLCQTSFQNLCFQKCMLAFSWGHPRRNWSFFFSVISTWLEKKNETICPDPLFLGNAMKAEFESWKKLRSQTPEVFHILAHWNFLISAHFTLWFWTQHCNTTPSSTNFDSKSSRMWFCTIPDSGTHLVPVPSLQPAYLPLVNKRASGPQQAKQGEELEKEKNQRGGLHKCVKSYRVDGTARNSESRKRVWIWPDMERI